MRKSLILALTAIGGGVGYAAGVTEVATGPSTDVSSTWRWHVSSILAAQSDTGSRRMEVGVDGEALCALRAGAATRRRGKTCYVLVYSAGKRNAGSNASY